MSKNATHTPGPWKTEVSPFGELEVRGPDGQFVAKCRSGDEVSNPPRVAAEREANARLVAAAPDQHAALRGCADMLKEAAKQFRLNGDDGHAEACGHHEQAARSAIAKFEGDGS